MMDELGCGGGRWMNPVGVDDEVNLDPCLVEGAWYSDEET